MPYIKQLKTTAAFRMAGLLSGARAMLLVFELLVLAGCGLDKDVSNQVAVRINSNEITIHQVNDLLKKNPVLAVTDVMQARRITLERLIDQQLAIDQAIERKLDRSPEVVSAIETAKRQILAQAYLQQTIGMQPKPALSEIKEYFDEHAELFAQRRVYELRALALQPSPEIKMHLESIISQGRSINEIIEFLQAQKIAFNIETAIRSADQLPLEALPKLARSKPDELITLETSYGFQIVSILATWPAPLDFVAASPRIEQFLFNQRTSEVMHKDLLRLRKLASIEYLDDSIDPSKAVMPIRNPPVTHAIAENLPETTGSINFNLETSK